MDTMIAAATPAHAPAARPWRVWVSMRTRRLPSRAVRLAVFTPATTATLTTSGTARILAIWYVSVIQPVARCRELPRGGRA